MEQSGGETKNKGMRIGGNVRDVRKTTSSEQCEGKDIFFLLSSAIEQLLFCVELHSVKQPQ